MRQVHVVAKEYIDTLEIDHWTPERFRPVSTGIDKLDETIGGIKPGMYVALGGGAKSGKSTFETHLAVQLAKAKRGKVGIFGLEELAEQTASRLIMRETVNVDRNDAYRLTINAEGFEEMRAVQARMVEYDLWVEDSVFELNEILAICDAEDIGYVFIDYMNLLSFGEYRNESERLSAISRKIIAARNASAKKGREENKSPITVFMLYQLNDQDKALGSRTVYRDADLIMEVGPALDFDDEPIDGKLNINVLPSRMAKECKGIRVNFSGAHSRIEQEVVFDFKEINVLYEGDEKNESKHSKPKRRSKQSSTNNPFENGK